MVFHLPGEGGCGAGSGRLRCPRSWHSHSSQWKTSGSSGAHCSKRLLKTWESVRERSTRGMKGLEKVLCSQTLFQGHNLLTGQIESEGAISLQ